MVNAKTVRKVRETLDAVTPGGNEIEQEAYKQAMDALIQRPDLTEKVIWAAAKYIAREIQEERRGFQAVAEKPKN
jgi:hypothetical protein